MIAHNTVTYERWADLVATPARALMVTVGAVTTPSPGGARTDHAYQLDLSTGSFAVQARALAARLTPERWFDALVTGKRASGAAGEPFDYAMDEPALVGAR